MPSPPESPDPSAALVAGRLRLDDGEELKVMLRITDTGVTLRSGRSELGGWSIGAVTITAVGDGSYDFVAEGDHLIFLPDDPESFSRLSLVTELAPPVPKKRIRIRRVKSQPAVISPADSPSHPVPLAPVPEVVPQPRKTRRLRLRRVPSLPSVKTMRRPRVRKPGRRSGWTPPRTDEQIPAPADGGPGRTRRAWLYAIDQARQVDLLGLDRVPVTQKLRAQSEHAHTWDHRVSAGFASRRLCTICGKVRIIAR